MSIDENTQCMSCGATNAPDSLFCSKCGTNLQEPQQPPPLQQQQPPGYPAPYPQQQYPPPGFVPYVPRSDNTALYVILGVCGTIIFGPILLFFFMAILYGY